ncbi:MAG: HAMP domain-containing histidine kinase [Bacilli bacterium]|nr:HAMP domain-containing histidine kinase [Bacilli bacterium]
MKKFSYLIYGFLGFTLVTGFNVSIGVLIYSQVADEENYKVAILLIGVILVNALFCSIIDVVRRKIMISKPVDEILNATNKLKKGNFNINLVTNHTYQEFDEFDIIKNDLNKVAKELARSEILKNDFIANLSHEIKTPLAVIKNYAKVLEDESISPEERKKYLHNLQEATKKLNALVTNILKLNKLEHQTLELEITNFNVSELLTEQILQFESLIATKDLKLEIDIEEDIYINSEQSYLEIIFNNLISNAIKFTNPNGTITITLKKKNNEYIFTFCDTGCGMDSETGMHIFDKFYQGDTSHAKEGNGLGLALVKRVIDLLGGEISVESEKGVGTTFKIIVKEIQNGR